MDYISDGGLVRLKASSPERFVEELYSIVKVAYNEEALTTRSLDVLVELITELAARKKEENGE